jgi:hypothetical protein
MTDGDRAAELAANWADVNQRVTAACVAAGRDPAEVTIIGVSKTWPASAVRLLAGMGLRDVGENRDREAAPKHDECADLALRWHFVGQLQRNKCRSVARYTDVVHSVDRLALVGTLSDAARAAGRPLVALVQVALEEAAAGAGPGRGGTPPDAVEALAAAITAAAGLDLGGVMAIAPRGVDPDRAFARLAEVAARMRRQHPDATMISAGMSGDLEPAVRAGATHLRVGTALFGARSTAVG